MSAVDALTVRTQITEQLDNRLFRERMNYYAELEAETNNRDKVGMIRRFGIEQFDLAIKAAETFYLSPNMQALAMRAAEDFPLDEVIIKEDQPSEIGFMYMPDRFRVVELRGRILVVHAALWSNTKIWLISNLNDPDDEIARLIREDGRDFSPAGQWDLCAMLQFQFGKPIPQAVTFDKAVLPTDAKVNITKSNGNVAVYTDHVIDIDRPPIARPDPFLMFMLSVWRLMQQTLASVHREDNHPRAFRRRAERKHVPTAVTVIQLRRREGWHVEGTGEHINYRTLVRGHWRRVWCGPMDGVRYQRAVYIHPFIRGPEDAPLIVRQRVNALVR